MYLNISDLFSLFWEDRLILKLVEIVYFNTNLVHFKPVTHILGNNNVELDHTIFEKINKINKYP